VGGLTRCRCMTGVVKIAKSPIHGRGMFATGKINRGSVIDRGYVLPFSDDANSDSNLIDRYAFDYDGKNRCLVLGITSLCNHRFDANAEIEIDDDAGTYRLLAVRDIKRGEEIFVDYGDDYWNGINETETWA
jgi:SET domain-containing protein